MKMTQTGGMKIIFLGVSGGPSNQCKTKMKLMIFSCLQNNIFLWHEQNPALQLPEDSTLAQDYVPLICSGSSILSHPEATSLFQRSVITT